MNKKPYHISIQEMRFWDSHLDHLVVKHTAHIFRGNRDGDYKHRMYECSEASILRLAKIQEKLAQ